MEKIIENFKNMTMDEIAASFDIDDIDRKFIKNVIYEYPEIFKHEGKLNEHLLNYRSYVRKENETILPRCRKIYHSKACDELLAFYGIIMSLGIDAINK